MSVRAVPGGILVEVRVRPRSPPGWKIAAGGLVIGVAAAPVGGAATEEARRALAKTLGVTPSRVSLHRERGDRLMVRCRRPSRRGRRYRCLLAKGRRHVCADRASLHHSRVRCSHHR
jgi:uncharacterized protein YggU (UPF0235/DUF167 family)